MSYCWLLFGGFLSALKIYIRATLYLLELFVQQIASTFGKEMFPFRVAMQFLILVLVISRVHPGELSTAMNLAFQDTLKQNFNLK